MPPRGPSGSFSPGRPGRWRVEGGGWRRARAGRCFLRWGEGSQEPTGCGRRRWLWGRTGLRAGFRDGWKIVVPPAWSPGLASHARTCRPPGKGVRAARPLPRPDPAAAALGFLPLGAPPGSPEVVAPCPGVGDTSPFGCPRCCTEHGLSPACSGPGRRVVPDFPGLCGSRDVVCTRNGAARQAAGVPDGSGRAQGSSAHWPRHCCRKAARHPGSRSAFLSGSLESRLRGGRPTDAGGPQGRPGP